MFVQAAVEGVLKEGAIAAGLTALMILLFLGSWRSTLIVATSIPLSILTSIIVLWALGQSLNIMTLGGMALAVGILVDDATVELENTHRYLGTKGRGEVTPPRARRSSTAPPRSPRRRSSPPLHLHRLRAGGVPDRPGRLPVHPAGPGGRLRHAGVVLPVAHAGADHGALPAAEGGSRSTAEGETRSRTAKDRAAGSPSPTPVGLAGAVAHP